MKTLVPFAKVVLLVLVIAAIAVGTTAYAKKPGGPVPCHPDIMCPDVWDPVICEDGKIYSNDCYAYVWCQTDCESIGGGPIPFP